MPKRADPFEGKGPRPDNPYVRLCWAAARGHGITLSAEECWDMHLDDAIATHAMNVAFGNPDDATGERPSAVPLTDNYLNSKSRR